MDNELIYLDSNIYIDYFTGRTDKLRPLGEFAFNLLKRTMECEYKIIISNLVIDELEFNGYKEDIDKLISDLRQLDKLIFIEETAEDEEKARKIKKEKKYFFK